MFELIINILLFIFFGYTFFTHVLEAAVPASVARNPYAVSYTHLTLPTILRV